MDGEEDEASKTAVNERRVEAGGGESAVEEERIVAESQCEPESAQDGLGGDVAGGGGEESARVEEVEKERKFETDGTDGVEKKVTEKLAAEETSSEKGGFDDVAAEVVNDSVPAGGDSADVAVDDIEIKPAKCGFGVVAGEETETVGEEGESTDAAVEETEMVPEEGGLAEVAEDESETVLEEHDLADLAKVETEMVAEKGDSAEVTAEETEMVPEDGGLEDVAAETETVAEEGSSADVGVEESKMVPEDGVSADVAAEETEMVLEEGGLADVAMEKKVDLDDVPQLAPEEMKDKDIGSETGVAAEEDGDVTAMGNVSGEGVKAEGVEAVKEEETVEEEEDDPEEEEVDPEEEEAEPVGEEADAMEAEAEEEAAKTEETDVADAMEEDEEVGTDEGAQVAETEEQEVSHGARGGKRKRGKTVKSPARATPRKKTEEDVCFICFDGGELVLCDRRGCPKAYHPTCVNRDDAFFRSKGRWNCGWHLCSTCGKNAYYMCYTCTFSLCKACVKSGTIFCVRGNKGFCESCMKTVKLIEKNEGNMNDTVNFDDKSSWEYLFKDYYTDLKEKLSLTLSELLEAKNPWKGSDSHAYKQESADEAFEPDNDAVSDSDDSSGNLGPSNSKRRKTRKQAKTHSKDKSRRKVAGTALKGTSVDGSYDWASKELLEFVRHMRDGDASVLSQFDVQALLLEYIKRNKLRDPRRKSQIICDTRLQNIFGKARVGHFEMLKLLELHFLIKEDSHVDDHQGSVVDTEASQLEADGNSDTPGKASKDKKRKSRRKGDGKGLQSNLDDFAAIDTHNINLIYLKRNLAEDLIDDAENLQNQAVGAFVRIRIAGSNQKQDLYRLVQVVGTSKAAEPYKVGKKVTDICLEILNLNKTETVAMDIISNQEFTEEECKRLRQSIKCGLINRLTVGDVQEKAIALQAVRVKDWLESEIVRLSHLRDRASETGRRKELRECVEKLQLLKTPEERQRRMEEIPEIHSDPNMDPNHESEDEDEAYNKRRENFMKARGFGRRGRDPISPRKGGSVSTDTWNGTRNYSNSTSPELSRNLSGRGFYSKMDETTSSGEIVNDMRNQGRDREIQQSNTWDKHKLSPLETGSRSAQSAVMPSSESFSPIASENLAASTGVSEQATKINESEKVWLYKDPSGKVQGPFSVVQLRKWSATGYFPADLRIWKQTEEHRDSLLLTDVLAGRIQKEKVQVVQSLQPSPLQSTTKLQAGVDIWKSQNDGNSLTSKVVTPTPVEVPKHSSDGWGTANLPSPTPNQTPLGSAKMPAFESKWSGSNENASTPSKPDQISVPPSLNNASGADIQTVVSNLQSLVQSVASHLPPSETRGWVKTEMLSTPTPGSDPQTWRSASTQVEPNNSVMMHGQPPAHGHWNDTSAVQNPASSFNTGNSVGNFPATGFQATAPSTDPWKPSSQSIAQPQNSGWGPPPQITNWGGPQPPPQNANLNWAVPGQSMAPTNANSGGWGPAPTQGSMHGNSVPGWVPPPVNANANQGWAGHGQGPQPGNSNASWAPGAPSGNQGGWGSERSHNSDRFGNQDSGYNGGKPWNRQSSFGGGGGGGGGGGSSSRPPFRGQRVCKFHESGHCKKGASCDYLHN